MNVYLFQAALLCEDCGERARAELTKAGHAPSNPEDEYTYDSDDFPKGPYPDGGGEADSPQHCDTCGTFLENPLTSEGIEGVREALADWHGAQEDYDTWKDFYRVELEDA